MSQRLKDELGEALSTALAIVCLAIVYGWPILAGWLIDHKALQ